MKYVQKKKRLGIAKNITSEKETFYIHLFSTMCLTLINCQDEMGDSLLKAQSVKSHAKNIYSKLDDLLSKYYEFVDNSGFKEKAREKKVGVEYEEAHFFSALIIEHVYKAMVKLAGHSSEEEDELSPFVEDLKEFFSKYGVELDEQLFHLNPYLNARKKAGNLQVSKG